jgi:CubicO group peptidase (beta-lactamase class C family)
MKFQSSKIKSKKYMQAAVGSLVTLAALFFNGPLAYAEATVRTPVAGFNENLTLEQSKTYQSTKNLGQWLGGGDISVWVNGHMSELLPTSIIPNRLPPSPLPLAINSAIGGIKAETKNFGTLTLDEFMAHPKSYAQAFTVLHKGRVVYENYPGMDPTDHHLWMSCGKILPSLVIDLLINDGKIDQNQTLGFYVPELRGSAWETIKVIDVLDMTPGLNTEENNETRADPNSIAIRFFKADAGLPYNGKVENTLEVLRSAKKVTEPGSKFEYGSPTTQILVYLAEAVIGERWAKFVDKRIWSKIGTEGPLQVHTSPDGMALGYGVMSSRLRDMARVGMLYTPSWNKVATEQIVTPDIIERIRNGVRSKAFYRNGYDGPVFLSRLNDDSMISNSRQWDAVWPDGDFWKSGVQGQALYVSPSRDLVIAFYSVNVPDDSVSRYLRPIATSGLFEP